MRIIAGRVGGRRIESPEGQDLRPMMDKVRAALFDMLWHFDAVRGRALDLYSGSGAVGIEALSRGAEFADFVELNSVSAKTIQHNLDTLGLTREGRVHRRKVEEILANPKLLGHEGAYDLITVTPPYPTTTYPALLQTIATSPLVAEGTMVVIEHPNSVELEDEVGPLVRVRERKYGNTKISIYDYPDPNADDEDEEFEDDDLDEDDDDFEDEE